MPNVTKIIASAALCDYLTHRRVPLDLRLPVGDHLRRLLGGHYDRFDAFYAQVTEASPRNPIPALTSLALLRLSSAV